MKEVSGAVQDHVRRRQDVQGAGTERLRGGPELRGIGLQAGGRGQNGVMQVHDGTALGVDERRQLMHPGPVIALVIRIELDRSPAGRLQGGFGPVQGLSRNHDVDVADQAASCGGQARGDIGRAFEEQDRDLQMLQRPLDPIQFPAHRSLVVRGQGCRGAELSPHAARDPVN